MHLRKRSLACLALSGALFISSISTPAYAAAGDSIFILGNTYDEVRQMQIKLKDLGYLKSNATGYFGTDTQQAFIAFQKDKGLIADGKAGPATQKALMGAVYPSKRATQPTNVVSDQKGISTQSTTPSTNAKGSIFVLGNRYDEVKQIQQRLRELGYLKAGASGYYGTDTQKAVVEFQRAKSLPVDGKTGPATQMALLGKTLTATKAIAQPATASAGNNGKEAEKAKSPSNPKGKGQQTVDLARKHMGKPYLWGGAGPSAFDCSGLVKYVLKQQGVDSIHNSHMMSMNTKWKKVEFKNLQPGDLMFFDTRTDGSAPIGHVGIYSGGGMMVHASSGSGKIIEASVNSSYFKRTFRIARRVF